MDNFDLMQPIQPLDPQIQVVELLLVVRSFVSMEEEQDKDEDVAKGQLQLLDHLHPKYYHRPYCLLVEKMDDWKDVRVAVVV